MLTVLWQRRLETWDLSQERDSSHGCWTEEQTDQAAVRSWDRRACLILLVWFPCPRWGGRWEEGGGIPKCLLVKHTPTQRCTLFIGSQGSRCTGLHKHRCVHELTTRVSCTQITHSQVLKCYVGAQAKWSRKVHLLWVWSSRVEVIRATHCKGIKLGVLSCS